MLKHTSWKANNDELWTVNCEQLKQAYLFNPSNEIYLCSQISPNNNQAEEDYWLLNGTWLTK